jgi:hypothetical protein
MVLGKRGNIGYLRYRNGLEVSELLVKKWETAGQAMAFIQRAD